MKNIKYFCLSAVAAWALTWIQYHPILYFLSLVALAGYLAVLILSEFQFVAHINLKQRALFFCIVSIWCCILHVNSHRELSELIKIKMGFKKYVICETSGVKLNDGRLSVCDVNDKWWRYGFTESVIYDSSGQIILKHNMRSQDWIRAALKLPSTVPFGVVGFDAERLTGNFYIVTFYDDADDLLENDIFPERSQN